VTDLDWVRDAVFYQIFPDRFANGDPRLDPPDVQRWGAPPTRDNFFGGDLAGIRGRMEHLSDLGVTAVYLTPIFAARTNHRYDTIDYFRIDPMLGNEAEFGRFVTAAHDAGIRVVLDAVFHHCGDGHPAFLDLVRHEADSRFVNWFYPAEFPVRAQPEPNYLTCSGCHYLPKLNVYNPLVREHLFDAVRKWTATGIDGWRLDVPYMMDNPYFWRQFRRLVKQINPDAYIVAEVWDAATEWTRGDTSDAAMNYRLRDALLDFVADHRTDAGTLARRLTEIDAENPAPARGLMLNLLGSHDTERLLTHCGGDPATARLALGLLFAAEGAPMIYYGDEVGMTGFNDPDCRRCMVWDESGWDRLTPDWVRSLARLRREQPALRRGTARTLFAAGDLFVWARKYRDDVVLVLANRGLVESTVEVPGRNAETGRDLLSGEPVKLGRVTVAAKEVRFVAPQ
jgi:glycosidase